jgi:hypothetical protein
MPSRALFLTLSALVIVAALSRLVPLDGTMVLPWFLGCGIMVAATHGCYRMLQKPLPKRPSEPQDCDSALVQHVAADRTHEAGLALFPVLFLGGLLVIVYGPFMLR